MSKKFPMYECPSFINCSSPLCPLDPDIAIRKKYKGEEECKAHKPTRMRIGKKYANVLPYKGLTKSEWAGHKVWDSLPFEKRKKIAEQGANRLKTLRNRF